MFCSDGFGLFFFWWPTKQKKIQKRMQIEKKKNKTKYKIKKNLVEECNYSSPSSVVVMCNK